MISTSRKNINETSFRTYYTDNGRQRFKIFRKLLINISCIHKNKLILIQARAPFLKRELVLEGKKGLFFLIQPVLSVGKIQTFHR